MTKITKPRPLAKVGKKSRARRRLAKTLPAKLAIVEPNPLVSGLWRASVSLLIGKPLAAAVVDGMSASVERSNTVICPHCGTYALLTQNERPAGLCARCAGDMTHARRATRDDIRAVVDNWNKPSTEEIKR